MIPDEMHAFLELGVGSCISAYAKLAIVHSDAS